MKLTNILFPIALVALFLSTSCSTTQKTMGGGLTSAVAQNVVRIACVEALDGADFSSLKDQNVQLKLTGFADERNRGILELLFRTKAEEAGGKFVSQDSAVLELEIATMSAGNDAGASRIPIIKRSERVEGVVDVQISVRKIDDRVVLHTQKLRGEAKYQQNTVVGFQGSGNYYVKKANGNFDKIEDPTSYR
jgi:hypothetical protein